MKNFHSLISFYLSHQIIFNNVTLMAALFGTVEAVKRSEKIISEHHYLCLAKIFKMRYHTTTCLVWNFLLTLTPPSAGGKN